MPGGAGAAGPPESGTLRQRIEGILEAGEATLRDLSRLARAPERLIPEALQHLRRSLAARGSELRQEPPECRECGFVFRERSRSSRPSRCPRCRSSRLSEARFRIVPAPGGSRETPIR